MTENKDLPAFPMLDTNNHDGDLILELRYEGLTKREYFAGLAMQGILANIGANYDNDVAGIAKESVRLSEALLSELNKTKP